VLPAPVPSVVDVPQTGIPGRKMPGTGTSHPRGDRAAANIASVRAFLAAGYAP